MVKKIGAYHYVIHRVHCGSESWTDGGWLTLSAIGIKEVINTALPEGGDFNESPTLHDRSNLFLLRRSEWPDETSQISIQHQKTFYVKKPFTYFYLLHI